MNKISVRVVCLLLSLILFTTTRSVWASMPQKSANTANLLLQAREESQTLRSAQIQSIISLLLQDDEGGNKLLVPLVRR